MITTFFIKGLLIGLSVAALVGPISILCIQRTMAQGFKIGFLTGLGAALADGIYGIIAGAGLATIANFLITYEGFIAALGSLFLFWLSVNAFKSVSALETGPAPSENSAFSSFGSGLLLTLSSPFTILSFTAIFAGLGLVGSAANYHDAILLVAGVFIGSLVWWLILCGVVDLLRSRLSQKVITYINRGSGMLLLTFACYALIKAGWCFYG